MTVDLQSTNGIFGFSGDPLNFEVTVSNDCFRLEVVVSVQGGIELGREKIAPVANKGYFDLHSYADAFLKSLREEPILDGSAGAFKSKSCENFVFEFTEIYPDLTTGSQQWVYLMLVRGATNTDTAYFPGFVANGQMLSFAPQPIPISSAGVAHFDWLNFTDKAIQIMAKFDYEDGTSTTTLLQTIGNCAKGLWHFAFPYSAIRPAATGDFISVGFWFRNALNQNISSVAQFDYREAEDRERYLVFENSVGGWDSIRMIGTASETVKYERFTSTIAEYNRTAATDKTQLFSIDFGQAALQYAAPHTVQNYIASELCAARAAYLVTPQKIVEVRLTNTEMLSYKDLDFNLPITIELEAVRISQMFETPTIATAPSYDAESEGYYTENFIDANYFI